MIRKILRNIGRGLATDQGEAAYHKYIELQKHEGWKVHQGLIIEIANQLTQYLLSEKYTNLPLEEKDAQQRAIYAGKEIIEFLLDPMKDVKKNNAIKWHNQQMEATMKGSDRKGGK